MKALAEDINTFYREKAMKRATFFQALVMFLIISSIAQAIVGLSVNGQDPSIFPLEVETKTPLEIALIESVFTKTGYDLTLSATGGVFLCHDTVNESEPARQEQITILGGIDAALFEMEEELSVIRLTTNQAMTIDNQSVSADTEVYQLIMFQMPDERVVVFGINYESLSYQPPVEEDFSQQAIQAESLESPDEGGEFIPMTQTTTQQQAPVWFDNPAECPDLDHDNFVNFNDFVIFAANWLKTGSGLAGDFDSNGVVDVNDLMHFCEYWLMETGCPSYSADTLPYTTSFESYQGFEPYETLDYQMGWQVAEGDAFVYGWWAEEPYDYFWYQFVVVDANSVATKQFNDEGDNHRYIHLNFIPAVDQKVSILNGSDLVASVWFSNDWKIYVLKDGAYVNTNVDYQSVYNYCWYYFEDIFYDYAHYYDHTWATLKLKMNWHSNTYEVYWNGDPNDITNQAAFDDNYDILTAFKTETTHEWGVINSFAIGDWTAERPYVSISSPCACDDDAELKGRIPIIGTAEGNHFGLYELYFCPAELAFTSQGHIDLDNWQLFHTGTNIVNNDVLGHWDTSRIPNGYYHLAVVVYNDLGYPEGVPNNWFQLIIKTVSIGGQVVYEGPGFFPVVGDLKCNTFYHEEEPEISVPWAGQFPFEFRRTYNNNIRFYGKSLRNGWTHNNQIKLIEDCRYNWETRDSGPFLVPAWDDNMLGFGYIWIQYPDGSRTLFRNENPQYAGSTVTYRPWPYDNTGEYVTRTSYTDGFLTIIGMDYTLHTREGNTLRFNVNDVGIPWGGSYGSYGWYAESGIDLMSDRFGNSLSFNWTQDKTAVTRITDGHATIEFDLQNGYYTHARLKVGQDIHRTIQFNYSEPIFTVTKVGKGVNEQGVYDSASNKQYVTKYEYDSGKNLRKIINVCNAAQNEPLIEVDYDRYGRVQKRRDCIEADNFLETSFSYTFFDPQIPGRDNYLRTVQSTDERSIITIQDDKGATLSQDILPSDGAAVTNTVMVYTDSTNPLRPTKVYEYFDNRQRYTENNYNKYGDLHERQVFIDEENFTASEFEYHPIYSLEGVSTAWQGFNKTGQKVQTLYVYGDADGTENTQGAYRVQEKVLLAGGDPNNPNEDVWATTYFEYYETGRKKGRVKSIIDPEGFVTLFDYDDNGYLSLIRKGDDLYTAEPVQRFYHDAIGQLVLEANALGGVTRHYYDGFGRVYKTQKYEDLGVMYRADPNSYTPALISAESRFGYNERGFRTFEQLESGGQVHTTFTRGGQPRSITYDDGSFIEFTYDNRGNKTQEYRYEYTTQEDWIVTFGYDSLDRLIETNWFDYDDTTLVKQQISDYYGIGQKKFDKFYGLEGTLEKSVHYEYDLLGRLLDAITDPAGFALTLSYDYDAVGNRIITIDPKGSVIYADYDNANRKIAEYFAAESETDPTAATIRKIIEYYDNNKVLSETRYDYDGTTVLANNAFAYDGRGRLIQVIQQIDAQNDAVTKYFYYDATADPGDPNSNTAYGAIVIEDAEEKPTTLTLDGFGRPLVRLYPSGDFEEYQYNGDGTLWKKAVWDDQSIQQWIAYDYDGYGRVVDANYPDMGRVYYTYDGFGRRTLVEDDRNATDNIGGSGEISYVYDVLNRIAAYTDQDGYTVRYAYRHDGQKQSVVVENPASATIYDVQYLFDTANRLEYVWDGLEDVLSGYIARLGYDDNGNRQTLTYYPSGSPIGSTVDIAYAYNLDNYLTAFSTTGGPTFSFDASQPGDIDGLGRLVSADETIGATSRTLSYTYDGLSQLKTASVSNIDSATWTASYFYHDDGNLETRTEGGVQTDHGYTGDLLTTVGVNNLTWNDNGNMTTGVGVNIVHNWDDRIQSAISGANAIDCIYDPEGRMIVKTTTIGQTTSTEKYILDIVGDYPMILVVVDPDAPSVEKCYYHANGQTLMQKAGASRYLYLHDRLGSTRQVINASASVVNSYTYDPWGNAFSSETSETVTNHYQFANYHWDSTVGMYYLNARWYDPVILRFTGRDPVKGDFSEPLTLHAYLYCLNNPVNMTDPEGLMGGIIISSDFRAQEAQRSHGALMLAKRVVADANFRNFTQGLRINLMKYSGMNPGSGFHAHHIFPKQFSAQFNQILGQSGLSINNPLFGTWLESGLHWGVHGAGYNAAWYMYLREANPQTAIDLINQAVRLGSQYGLF